MIQAMVQAEDDRFSFSIRGRSFLIAISLIL